MDDFGAAEQVLLARGTRHNPWESAEFARMRARREPPLTTIALGAEPREADLSKNSGPSGPSRY